MADTIGKVINCRAAVAWGPKTSLTIEEIEVATPKSHEVRVKMVATGICRSDLSVLNGLVSQVGVFPVILGHEGAGIVESVGEGVTKFMPGDHVIPLYVPQCFDCPGCKNPKTNLCQKIRQTQLKGLMPDGTTRFSCKGQTLFHSMGTSTFSEYTVVSDISLAKINKEAALDKVCLIGCAISTGYGAALNTANVEPRSRCAIWGLGGIGLAAVMGCRNAGASKIYGIDIKPEKFKIAKEFGCTDFINPRDFAGKNIQDILFGMTNGGFDYTFECIGNVDAMKVALESTNRNWGVCTLIGIPPYDKTLDFRPLQLVIGRTVKGSIFGGWRSVEAVPKLVDDYMNKKILVDEFITHTMSLEQIGDAFVLMKDGKSIRSVVIF